MSELDEILNGEHQLNKMHIENDTVAFNTEKDNYVWNLTPRDIEYIIYNLQQELKQKNKIIEEINRLQHENKELKKIIKDNTLLVKDDCGNYEELNVDILDLQQELNKKNKIIEEQNTKIKDFTDFSLEIYKSYFHHTKDMWLNELLHNYFDDINYGTDFKLEELEKGSEE